MAEDSRLSTPRPAAWGIPLGVGVGAAIGMIFGILLDQLAMGLLIGAAIGLVFGTSATTAAATPAERRGRVIAAAVGFVTAGVAVAVWILTR